MMAARTLAELARVTGGHLHGRDAAFATVSIDSRRLARGDLFVALSGTRVDGHDFVTQAAAAGAVGALVERVMGAGLSEVQVADARVALAAAAAAWRARFDLPLIGVTGSNGKTTTKQLLASILGQRGPTLATEGNLNNELGVPLTLFRLAAEHRAAVIEMGASRIGDIAALAALARPTVAVVTNAGPAHLEGFGSLAGVAIGKGELFSSLAADGVAVINADDPQRHTWEGLAAGRRVLRFGRAADASVRIVADSERTTRDQQEFELDTPQGRASIRLGLPGAHNAMNAAAAAAAALAAGATLAEVVAGLAAARNVGGRLALRPGRDGYEVVDDTYNANPASMHAALAWATALGRPVVFAMGDMGELGPGADALHAEVGAAARRLGVRRLFATGVRVAHAVSAFGAGASLHADVDALVAALRAALQPGDVLLVKGSRSARMERVVAALTQSVADGGGA